jgi:hypothetical protein
VRSDLHPNNPNKYKYHKNCSLLLTIIGTELVGHKARCAQLAEPATIFVAREMEPSLTA